VQEDPYTDIACARIILDGLYTGKFKNRMIPGGFEVVYDRVGSQKTVQDSRRWARSDGTVVLAGVSR
jgi:threonine dehydrogenase-like Zn-dependent dehydrogenase